MIERAENSEANMFECVKKMRPDIYLGSIGFRAFKWQLTVVNCKSKRIILLCSRQAGKSTIVSSIPCHTAKYHEGSLNIVIAPTEDQAKEDILKIKDFIAHDPTYPELKRDGSDVIALDNGSRIIVVVATDRSARGYSKPRTVVLDEASRIPDVVYKSGVVPMMNHNPQGKIYMLSTPFGKSGFFYNTWTRDSKTWTKIFARTPYDVDPMDSMNLIDAEPEEEFSRRCAAQGIIGLYSPNHANREEQLAILEEVGETQYQQEFCCDFVEMEGQVFRDADLARYFAAKGTPFESAMTIDEKTKNVRIRGEETVAPMVMQKVVGGRYF